MFKNYISVSFQVGEDASDIGCVLMSIGGPFTFEGLKPMIADFIKKKYDHTVDPKDITITAVSEVSKSLYKRLIK